MYTVPNEEFPCWKCVCRRHDTNLGELWCDHQPPPEGLGNRLIISEWGTCEFFEISSYF